MPCSSDHKNTIVTPAQDNNAPSPPVPADHVPQTPEFLTKLIQELKSLRQEQSELFAKMYPMSSSVERAAPPTKPPYEQLEEYKRQDQILDQKIGALKGQIQELHVLLARPFKQTQGLEKA